MVQGITRKGLHRITEASCSRKKRLGCQQRAPQTLKWWGLHLPQEQKWGRWWRRIGTYNHKPMWTLSDPVVGPRNRRKFARTCSTAFSLWTQHDPYKLARDPGQEQSVSPVWMSFRSQVIQDCQGNPTATRCLMMRLQRCCTMSCPTLVS